MQKKNIIPSALALVSLTWLFFSCSTTKQSKGKQDKQPEQTASLEEIRHAVNQRSTMVAMELANQYFMEKWKDPKKIIHVESKHKSWPSNIWTRGVYYEGLMDLYQINKNPALLQYAVRWADDHEWDLRDGYTTTNADNQCAGQTYFNLFLLKKDTNRIQAIKASIDRMVSDPKVDYWDWIDAIQMAMPVFAQLGNYYNEPAYYEKMWAMYQHTRNEIGGTGLYNPEDHLWWRDKDFLPPYKEPNGKDCYWSRGNGWVVAALVRVLSIIPPTAPHHQDYLNDYRDMMAAVITRQRTDGYWNVSLDDPAHFGGKELTGTALFTYGLAWGIRHHVLDEKTYLPHALKAWDAMVRHSLHPNGFLGFVQGTGKEPKDSQPVGYDHVPDFEDFGLGCFLLAGSQMYLLVK